MAVPCAELARTEAAMAFRSSLSLVALAALVGGCGGEVEPAPLGNAPVLGRARAALTAAPPGAHGASCGDHGDEDAPELREHAQRRVSWRGQHRPGPRGTVAAKILGFNDFHGQLAEGRLVAGRPVGGAAVLASYLQTSAADFAGRALIVHAGDFVGASPPESALLQDEPSIQFLNTLANRHCHGPRVQDDRCNVVGTAGNHEFDEGQGELLRLIYGGNHPNGPFLADPYPGARFPYVSANVVHEEDGDSLLPRYVVRKLGGVAVGVVGAVLKETPTIVTPTGVAGLSFLDEATAINDAVNALKKKGVRSIIVTIHQGAPQTSYTGATDPSAALGSPISNIVAALDGEVDLVVSGHSHSFSNALLPNADGTPVLVTQAFSASTAFADIDLELDRATGDVIAKSASIVSTYSDVAPGNVRDPEVQAIVTAAAERVAPLINQVVAQVAGDATRTQTPAGESTLGNLIADAQRAATGTDFAFMNPGGIRADLLFAANPSLPADSDGAVLWGELFTIQPFGNSLVTMSLTGQQVYDLLNQQFALSRFLQISGLEYSYDDNLPAAERVVEARQDGAAIERAATYSVTVNNFIATGGDGFTVLLGGENAVGGDIDLDALIAYLSAQTGPVAIPVLGRITRLN
ncbi:MAG: bifunctional metallophosphatase/5'-nucleotidase [Polyangiaceae bacterium]